MERKARIWIGIAAINGLMAVGAGAFGAHFLESRLDPRAAHTFELAARYQMYHSLALLGISWLICNRSNRIFSAAAMCLLVGIVLFSGSLYGLSLAGWRWLGPVTPIGGAFLLLGWLLLTIGALKPSRSAFTGAG